MTQVYFDIDTQIDFMFPAGSLYVPGAEKLIPTIAALNRRAPRLISTMCEHAENDPEFETYPAHCVTGTLGQTKPASLLVPNQILFPKQELNAFASGRLLPMINEFKADGYVVYGVVTEICVRFAVEKLLTLGKPVTIVKDAIRHLDAGVSDSFLQAFAAGAGLVRSSTEL
jgi:nicotinamidase/pyrazinamidase